MFRTTLLTVARTGTRPKRPSTEECIKKMWYIYTMEYDSAVQKNEVMPFTATLFTTAKKWKQPKCPSTNERIKKMWYIYTMEYYSAIKKNKIMPFAATWMQLKILILSEVRQKEKDKYHMILLTCRI